MSTTTEVTIPPGLPVSYNAVELFQSDIEVLVLIVNAGLFQKGCLQGRLNTQDLADAGILQRVVEAAEEDGVDIRELPGNDWGSRTPPAVERLIDRIRESGSDHSEVIYNCADDCECCQAFCR